MKRIIICIYTVFQLTGTIHAQTDNSDIDIVQSIFGKSKRLIINEYIKLDNEEKKLFWPIYDQYEEKRKSIQKERFILLKEYADNYEELDAAKAGKLVIGFLNNIDKYNKLYKAYFKKAEKAIGGLKAATFIQLETFIQTALQANLQSQVPVIGELGRLEDENPEQYKNL